MSRQQAKDYVEGVTPELSQVIQTLLGPHGDFQDLDIVVRKHATVSCAFHAVLQGGHEVTQKLHAALRNYGWAFTTFKRVPSLVTTVILCTGRE